MKFKAWELISRAVEEGTRYGVQRAFKHSEPKQESIGSFEYDETSREYICENVECEVLNALAEVIDFEGEDQP